MCPPVHLPVFFIPFCTRGSNCIASALSSDSFRCTEKASTATMQTDVSLLIFFNPRTEVRQPAATGCKTRIRRSYDLPPEVVPFFQKIQTMQTEATANPYTYLRITRPGLSLLLPEPTPKDIKKSCPDHWDSFPINIFQIITEQLSQKQQELEFQRHQSEEQQNRQVHSAG